MVLIYVTILTKQTDKQTQTHKRSQ